LSEVKSTKEKVKFVFLLINKEKWIYLWILSQ